VLVANTGDSLQAFTLLRRASSRCLLAGSPTGILLQLALPPTLLNSTCTEGIG